MPPEGPSLGSRLWAQPLEYYPILLYCPDSSARQVSCFSAKLGLLGNHFIYPSRKKVSKGPEKKSISFQNSLLSSIDENRKSKFFVFFFSYNA